MVVGGLFFWGEPVGGPTRQLVTPTPLLENHAAGFPGYFGRMQPSERLAALGSRVRVKQTFCGSVIRGFDGLMV
jgi:hypothetical protein